MTERYSEAVDWLKQLFRPYVKGRSLDMGENEPSEIFFRFALRIVWVSDEKGGRYHYPESSLVFLEKECSRSPGALRLLADICAAHVARSEPIPEVAKYFAALLLAGKISFPKRSKVSKTYNRNLYLYGAALACESDFGLRRTRNDETRIKTSACDAVADALTALGHKIEPRAIKEIFIHQSYARLRESAAQVSREAIDTGIQFPEVALEWAKAVNRKPLGTE